MRALTYQIFAKIQSNFAHFKLNMYSILEATGSRPEKNYGVSIFIRRDISLHHRLQTSFEEDQNISLMRSVHLVHERKVGGS
jgi:hypothetical protein